MTEYLSIVSADRLIDFVRRVCSQTTIFGGDSGGNSLKLLRLLQNEEKCKEIAKVLWEIDYEYNKVTKLSIETLVSAGKIKSTKEKEFIETIQL